jgi:ubiquinone/menaquinone biosynthesis C-methylase UbiE
MTIASASIPMSGANPDYALGYTSKEHDRLVRQAALIAPVTERLFREAGIGAGQRVLDVGSGLGDVAMLLANLVGPKGQVVGVERDAGSIALARSRAHAAGFDNVSFLQTDVSQIQIDKPFDAAVGRFILMFLPDPASVLRSLARLVRPGGVLAFQEPSWIPILAQTERLPLLYSLLCSLREIFNRSGANTEMGPDLYKIFQEISLPAPAMRMETLLGADAEFVQLFSDLAISLQPMAQQHKVSLAAVGDLDTLGVRVQSEIAASNTVTGYVPLVGVWSRKPAENSFAKQ